MLMKIFRTLLWTPAIPSADLQWSVDHRLETTVLTWFIQWSICKHYCNQLHQQPINYHRRKCFNY